MRSWTQIDLPDLQSCVSLRHLDRLRAGDRFFVCVFFFTVPRVFGPIDPLPLSPFPLGQPTGNVGFLARGQICWGEICTCVDILLVMYGIHCTLPAAVVQPWASLVPLLPLLPPSSYPLFSFFSFRSTLLRGGQRAQACSAGPPPPHLSIIPYRTCG